MANKRILIIDDEDGIREFLQMLLTNKGYDVLTARNGTEGLHLAVTEKPDLILLDLIMPGMDGIEVCFRLKDDEIGRHIPILGMSGLPNTEGSVRGYTLAAGFTDFIEKENPVNPASNLKNVEMVKEIIHKPFRIDDIIAAVERLLGQHGKK